MVFKWSMQEINLNLEKIDIKEKDEHGRTYRNISRWGLLILTVEDINFILFSDYRKTFFALISLNIYSRRRIH